MKLLKSKTKNPTLDFIENTPKKKEWKCLQTAVLQTKLIWLNCCIAWYCPHDAALTEKTNKHYCWKVGFSEFFSRQILAHMATSFILVLSDKILMADRGDAGVASVWTDQELSLSCEEPVLQNGPTTSQSQANQQSSWCICKNIFQKG